jgi:hypothetical protein
MSVSASAPRAAVPRAVTDRVRRLIVPKLVVPLAFAVSAFWFAWQAGHISSYIWLIDEMLYVKTALGYAGLDGILPHVHGAQYGVPNVLYMLLLAPFFGLLSTTDAFQAAHIMNGILWASSLFPVYLLVRRLGASWGWALFAGLLTVWVPFGVATLTLMTETVAYAAFPWALLAMTVAVAEPRPRNDALALLAIVVAIAARTQLVFLLPVFLVSILVVELSMGDRADWRRRLRGHRALVALIAALALLVGLIQLVGGDLLGGYSTTSEAPPFTEGMWAMGMRHVAAIVVGLGIVPTILFVAWAVRGAGGPATPFERGFLAVALLCLGSLFYVAAFFGQTVASVVQERYVAYAVPIVVAGAVALVADWRRPVPKVAILAGAAAAVLGISGSVFKVTDAAGAFDRVANPAAGYNLELEKLVPEWTAWFPGRDLGVNEGLILIAAILGVVVMAALASRWRRFLAPLLMGLVLAFTVAETRWLTPLVITGMNTEFPGLLPGVRDQPYDWVDRSLPGGDNAGLLAGRLEPFVEDQGNHWMWVEFWNKDIERAYTPSGSAETTGWPAYKWRVDEATGRFVAPDDVDAFVVSRSDPRIMLQGRMVETATYGAGVLRPTRPLRAAWYTQGLKFDGGPEAQKSGAAVLHLYEGGPERVSITLEADTVGPEDEGTKLPWRVEDARGSRGGTLAEGQKVEFTVRPIPAGDGHGVVRLKLPELKLKGMTPAQANVRLISVEPA